MIAWFISVCVITSIFLGVILLFCATTALAVWMARRGTR